MIDLLFSLYGQTNNFFYLFAFVLALCLGCEKRRHFALRAAAGLVAGTALAYLYSFIPGSANTMALLYIVKYFLCFFMVYLCMEAAYKSRAGRLLYFSICGYSFQHLAYSLALIAGALFSIEVGTRLYVLAEFLVTAATFAFMFFVYRRLIAPAAAFVEDKLLLPFALLLTFAVVMSVLGFGQNDRTVRMLLGGYAALLCVTLLYAMYKIARASLAVAEKQTVQALSAKQKEQYDAYRKNIDYINAKCHDLKKQIGYLRGNVSDEKITEMQRAISIYDTAADTGCKTLDVILSEKGLQCEREKISFTYMADGSLVDFMDPVDICAIFCNLLDNAAEAASAVPDPERRIITPRVTRMGNLAHIAVGNSCVSAPKGGDFATTKADKTLHGFGLKSVRASVSAYDGEMKIYARDGTFDVDILIPLRAE